MQNLRWRNLESAFTVWFRYNDLMRVFRDNPFFLILGMQYGLGIKALTTTLNTEGMINVSRIYDFLSASPGLPVCAGTVSAIVKELAVQLGGTVCAVFQALSKSPVNQDKLTLFLEKNPYLQTAPTEFGFYRIGLYIEDFSGNQTPIL